MINFRLTSTGKICKCWSWLQKNWQLLGLSTSLPTEHSTSWPLPMSDSHWLEHFRTFFNHQILPELNAVPRFGFKVSKKDSFHAPLSHTNKKIKMWKMRKNKSSTERFLFFNFSSGDSQNLVILDVEISSRYLEALLMKGNVSLNLSIF